MASAQTVFSASKSLTYSFKLYLNKRDIMSLKGHNYGQIVLQNSALAFNSKQGPNLFKLKYSEITNATLANKQQILIQTKNAITNNDCLTDIRLFFDNPKEETDHQQTQEINMQREKNKGKSTNATQIYKQIMKRSSLGQNGGQSIATVPHVSLAVPRGKYTLDFYAQELRFHGATFQYKIKYQHVNKGFFLLLPNDKEVVLILQLHNDHPIYQGQTVHKYIVFQIKKDLMESVKTRKNPELLQKHPRLAELQDEYNSNMYQVIIDLLNGIAKILMIHPGHNFKSKDGNSCIRANVKAQTGWLYMLKQSIIFIFKPVVYLKLDQISLIQFVRTASSNKNFDIVISLKGLSKKVELNGIQSQELDRLLQYFKSKDVSVSVQQSKSGKVQQTEGSQDSKQQSQQDEDYNANQQDQQSQGQEEYDQGEGSQID